ncbi:hypothetical protein BBO99_00002631 [Phytophthora kernoviae]|uniref:CCHC-type domain-containing protein n=2 Tax=Phytophthora kernoviae TaxID=325452 RepID=A0A3R7H3A2_9STRA|nr:hypothetical protein JM18_009859 [Phytophthora kernoviae]RLN14133.1 hypothetical protein BBI17_002575 [Phytophthora kernoviae]RLN82789.1 hypothetical protein BBO99_00002631 [Phytophthora kernoviae]
METDWVNYFWDGRVSGELGFDKVKSLMGVKLKMDVQLTDANSRVSKLAHEMYQVLEKENMEWMVESEPKKVVHYMIDALAPEQFQRTVRNEMARESNKPLLKNVIAFITWLWVSCKKYVRWEPSFGKRGQTGSSSRQGLKKAEFTGAVQNPSQGARTAATRLKRTCLKCGSEDHRVKECLQTKAGEAESLLSEWREKRGDKPAQLRNSRPVPIHSIKALQLTETPLEMSSTCVARVGNAVDLEDVLLDSGSDVNVVDRGLVKKLQDQGVVVDEETSAPHRLAMFDGRMLAVTQQEKSKGTMILSQPVIERLGYSVDATLACACDTHQEWDLQDLPASEIDGSARICLLRGDPLQELEVDDDL